MTEPKQTRAAAIINQLLVLDRERGTVVPARPNGRNVARYVEDRSWRAWITQGQRVAFAPVYVTRGDRSEIVFGERRVPDREWTMVEIEANRRLVFIANLRGEEIDLFRYIPGMWERWFGVENGGDHMPHDKVHFPRPNSPELQELLQSPDAQLSPERWGPAPDAGAHEALLADRARRRRWRAV